VQPTAYACVLGGDDRQTLFVMTGTTSDRFEIADKTLGRIEAVHVEVAGAGTRSVIHRRPKASAQFGECLA